MLKWLQWRFLPLVLLLLAGVALLLFEGQSHLSGDYAQAIQALNRLQLADTAFDRDLLRLWGGVVEQYDDLNRDRRRLRRAMDLVQRRFRHLRVEGDDGFRVLLDGLGDSVDRKLAPVERFKTANALLQNSSHYFNLAVLRLAERASQAHASAIAGQLTRLAARVNQLREDPQGFGVEPVRRLLRQVVQAAGRALPGSQVGSLELHGRKILSLLPQLDREVRDMLAEPLEARLDTLRQQLILTQQQVHRRDRVYRYAAFGMALVLLYYLLAVMHRLRRRSLELRLANRRWRHQAAKREQMARALDQEHRRVLATLQAVADAVLTTDGKGYVDYMNPAAASLLATDCDRSCGRHLEEVVQLRSREGGTGVLPLRALLHGRRARFQVDDAVLVRGDGVERIIEVSATSLTGSDGSVPGIVLVMHDRTEQMRLTEQIVYHASHDALTGLVNRREFERMLDEALRDSISTDTTHVLCFIDLDQFKVINDTCGHSAGDILLKQVADLFATHIRNSDTLARLGGDEFGLLLRGCGMAEGRRIARKLLDALSGFRFEWEGRQFELGASLGLVAVDGGMQQVAELLKAADVACYTAKDAGRNCIREHGVADAETARRQRELDWVADIRRALEENRFCLYAQPIRRIGTDDEADHHEILLRMKDGHGRSVSPAQFVPAAERYQFMSIIDRWVIDRALAFMAGPGRDCGGFSINLSGNSLGNRELTGYVADAIARHGVDPGRICFEITETAVIENLDRATRFIQEMKAAGCRFALDDFGSGLSSFAYLKQWPVDYLKIDGCFVRNMIDDATDEAMVAAINQLGHFMGIRTIAEFVEDGTILERLHSLGVDYAQGYHLGRPAPLETLVSAPRHSRLGRS